jgi:isopentenyl-diphosphate delta-isomerase
MSIKQRKKDHVKLTIESDVQYTQSTGFKDYRFIHNALPEVSVDAVSTECTLLGRTFDFPLFISSMTGGYSDAGAVNAVIAEFCEEHNLPFGVGSQRVMLENPDETESFAVVRERAPSAFIAANIGGVQVAEGLPNDDIKRLIDSIEADALIVHLNPLQELMQPEGDRNFKGVEEGIAALIDNSPVPVMIKETGAGISGTVAERLLEQGASVIDIAGAGGTSWAKVEIERSPDSNDKNAFDNWGMPTLDCLHQVHPLKDHYDFEIITSGGVRSSFDIMKALCLGADFTAAAQPVIKAVVNDGPDGLAQLYSQWKRQAVTILTLLGCNNIGDLGPKMLHKIT